jgi:hypothetical protein
MGKFWNECGAQVLQLRELLVAAWAPPPLVKFESMSTMDPVLDSSDSRLDGQLGGGAAFCLSSLLTLLHPWRGYFVFVNDV